MKTLFIAIFIGLLAGQASFAVCISNERPKEKALEKLKDNGYFCSQDRSAMPPGPFEGEFEETFTCLSTVNGPSVKLVVRGYAKYIPGSPLCFEVESTETVEIESNNSIW